MAFDLQKAAYGKPSVSNLDKIQHIPLTDITPNGRNFYSIDNIEELADTVKMVGLIDPIRVLAAENNNYLLISGHRRYEAYKLLAQEDDRYQRIPALVFSNLDDLDGRFALIVANSTTRQMTYADKLKQEKELREVLLAMKAAGRAIPHNLSQYIADQIGVSRNEVSRMHSVNENLVPDARAKVDAGEMTAQQAYELSRKPKEEQTASLAPKATEEVPEAVIDRNVQSILPRVSRLIAEAKDRKEAVAAIRAELRNIGRTGNGIWWDGFHGGFAVRHGTTCRVLSWTETYERAVQLMAQSYQAQESVSNLDKNQARESVSKLDTTQGITNSWQSGIPPRDGCYACCVRLSPDGAPIRRVMFWRDGAWLLNGSSASAIADNRMVIGWIPLPQDDPAADDSGG